ncbi:MAG TPA: helix-turn-helix domain-containing protein [Trebonia sp.]|jgi:AraC-like DNA-binding protein|nr:helix-turn-helix domain-containing protein [Trebonia sp.]
MSSSPPAAAWAPSAALAPRARWVPAGAWLAPGYAEWPAPPALRGAVACLWTSVVPAGGRENLVLPDACSDLIWEEGAGAYVAGPDTGAVSVSAAPDTVLAGVRFRPAAGGAVLGLPLSEISDRRVPLADLLPAAVAGRLPPGLDAAVAAAAVLDVAGRLVADRTPDPAMAHAAGLLRGPVARAEDVAAVVGLSERQFRRRFQAAAGYGPKTLHRVLRFQRFVRRLDAAAGTPDLAAVAADAGYADQAHLTRECRALAGLTPGALAGVRGRALRMSVRR